MDPNNNDQQPNGGGLSPDAQNMPTQQSAGSAQPFPQPDRSAETQPAAPSTVQPTNTDSALPVQNSETAAPSNAGAVVSSSFVSDDKPPKKRNKLLITGVAAVATIALVSAAVFGLYLPNQPQNVWNTGLDRTGSTLDKMVIDATAPEKLETIRNTEVVGSIEGTAPGYTYSGSFTSKYDPKSSDSGFEFKYAAADEQERTVSLKVLADLPDGSDYPDLFFQLNGLSSLGLDAYMQGLSEYDGKWISVSSEYLQTLIPAEEYENSKRQEITYEEAAEAARAVSAVTREYVFSSDEEKSILVQKQFVGTEELEDGMKANHYEVGINKANAKDYCRALIDAFMSSDAYKKLPGVNEKDIAKDIERETEDCQKSVEEEVDEDKVFDMWIDRKYKLIHKVRLTHEDDKGEYIEIGQNFKGGDVMPLFVTYNNDTKKSFSKTTLDIDTANSTTKGTFSYDQEGEQSYSVKADFEFRPIEGNVDIVKPADAIPIQELFQGRGLDSTVLGTFIDRSSEEDSGSARTSL